MTPEQIDKERELFEQDVDDHLVVRSVRGHYFDNRVNYEWHGYLNRAEIAHAREQELLDALDHIVRVAHKSRTQNRRTRWIASRAESAINGDENWKTLALPKCVENSAQLSIENKHLKQLLGEAADKLAPITYDFDFVRKIREAIK